MYKLLLSWRYLCTRYIALASIISVTLGVATMIVVNSVMSGFTTEMQNRIHGILSDVVVESLDFSGFRDADWHMDEIRKVAGDDIEAMTPTVYVPAMLNYTFRGHTFTKPIQLIGIDPKTQGQVSDFSSYLQHRKNREGLSFNLRRNGYDTEDHQATDGDGRKRPRMERAGTLHRRDVIDAQQIRKAMDLAAQPAVPTAERGEQPAAEGPVPADPFPGMATPDLTMFQGAEEPQQEVDLYEQHAGAVVGFALVNFPYEVKAEDGTLETKDGFMAIPGDDIKVTFPTVGMPPEISSGLFTVVDLYESKMSEYDSSFVFVPIDKLQKMRGMNDPSDPSGALVNSIQIKLKPGVKGSVVRDKLRKRFSSRLYMVSTWQDKQSALLAAVQMETAILNVLLFLIIAVAGFGILAIFFMIVVEKTRDIGILKSLGASGWGVMGIFLSYGLALGLLGSGVGMGLGLLIVAKINWIADLLGKLTGRPVFDPEIYYFYEIPTIVNPTTVVCVVFGAVAIAVLSSVMPAVRAARLHPVEALRYE